MSEVERSNGFREGPCPALFFLLDDDQAVIVKVDEYVLLVGYTSTGYLKIEDVTERLGDLEEGSN